MPIILLTNARIHTLDPRFPRASTLVIEEGRIRAVGGDELIEAFRHARLQDMGGRVILPGLIDSHIHLQEYALSRQRIECETSTLRECLERVAARARQTPAGEWILGHGWNHNLWQDFPSESATRWPTAVELDAIAPLHPVWLTAKSLHVGWANSLALRRAKIHASTPDPKGGAIQRDERGRPTGILFEGAMEIIQKAIPAPRAEALAVAIREALPSLWQFGLTGIHDFDSATCFRALQILHQQGELRLRVLKAIPISDLDDVSRLQLYQGQGDDFLRIGPVKLFADGALGSHTAALLDCYVDEPQNRGILLISADEVFEYGRRIVEGEFGLAIHAIGDRANRVVLDGLARLRQYEKENHLPARPHRLEHVQLLHPLEVGRLAELGLVASMQPIHLLSDMEMAERSLGNRPVVAYGWKTQIKQGAVLAFGSDAPVESPNPFLGLYAALTRRRLDGYPGPDGRHPEERLSLDEALKAYTWGGAQAAGWEHCLGQLKTGSLADLIVLDSDPFACEPQTLATLRPVATMVGGEWVWEQK